MAKAGGKELNITAEICEKVLLLDCRTEDGIRRLKKSLIKLPMFKSEEDLNTDNLERVISKIEVKHMIHLSYVMRSVVDCENHYTGMIKTENDGRWLKTVYGKTTWEVFAKALFFFAYHIDSERKKMRNRRS